MMYAKDHRQRARQALSGNWGMAVLVCFIAGIFGAVEIGGGSLNLNIDQETLSAISPETLQKMLVYLIPLVSLSGILGVVRLILSGPLSLGYCTYMLNLHDRKPAQLKDLFSQFGSFLQALIMQLLIGIFIALWTLLFIIPGIIASYSYAMAPYIMAENPEMSGLDAIRASKSLMSGHKFRLFCLDLSFIGWNILSLLTLGIGSLFITPYNTQSRTSFYRELVPHKQIFDSEV